MKKSKLFLLGAILASFSFNAAAQDTPFDQANIPEGGYNHGTSSTRRLESFQLTNFTGKDGSLNEPTFTVNQDRTTGCSIYYNLTEGSNPIFQTKAGNTVKFASLKWGVQNGTKFDAGSWMHGYLFINYNKDQGFNSKLNTTGFTLSNESRVKNVITVDDNEGELVSFSCFNLNTTTSESNDYFVNSRGTNIPKSGSNIITYGSGVTTETMPEFTIPSNLDPGTYEALFKIDWSYLDQHGNPGTWNASEKKWNNRIGENGGVIVRFTIEVVAHDEHTVTVKSSDPSKGSVSLKVDGQATTNPATVNSTQTVVAVATPEADHYFYNWTDDATNEVVSTDSEYTFTVSDDLSLTAHFLTQEEFDNLPDEAFDPNKITSKYNRIVNGKAAEDRFLDRFRLTNGTGSSLNEPIFNVDQPKAPNSSLYVNLTEGDNTPIFQTQPGNTVRFDSIAGSMSWLHGYVFIDYNKDGGFNSKLNTTGYTLSNQAMINSSLITVDDKKGELVSFSCFNLNTTGVDSNDNFVDSRGNSVSKTSGNGKYYGDGVTPTSMPEFMIPEDLEPGIYDALFKTDWSHIGQHGNPGTWNTSTSKWDNIIGDNGGCIVRFQIEVVKPLYITGHTETNTSYWNAAIVTLNYSATGVAEDEELVAVASQTGSTVLAAAATFTTLADDETGAPEDQEDVIKAREASPDGTILTFNLDKGQTQAQLLFEQPTWDKETGEKTDNFTPNTQYTYDVVLKKVDAEGNVTGEGNTYTTLQFTTSPKNDGNTAGVEDVTADDSNAPARYYNLQGIEVAQPAAGQIYIMRQGNSVQKVLVK